MHTGTSAQWVIHRPGKRECVWQENLDLADVGSEASPTRRVYRLTERTIDKHGNALLLPEYVLEGWTTTLPARLEAATSTARGHHGARPLIIEAISRTRILLSG